MPDNFNTHNVSSFFAPMSHRTDTGLLVILFVAAVLLTVLLLPEEALQAAPVFQSSPPEPTPTATPIPTPIPPDLSLSSKTVSQSIATVGDVLTYTVTIVNMGGPVQRVAVVDFFRPELSYMGNLTHTGNFSLLTYVPVDHAIGGEVDVPTGPVTITLSWQMKINQMPPGGILTNTVGLWYSLPLLYREAVTLVREPTPTPTATPPSTATPTPTATPSSTVTPTPTATPTSTVMPTSTKTPSPTGTAAPTKIPGLDSPVISPQPTGIWTPPSVWPKLLPETGK